MAKRRGRYSRSRQGPSWLMTGILMGLSVVVVMNWEFIRGHINHAMNSFEVPKLSTQPSKQAPAKVPKKPQTQSPEFDFYNMLANQKTEGAKPTPAQKPVEPVTTAPISEVNASEKPGTGQYVIQIASLSNYQQADRRKAELTMMGFDVSIQPYRHNNSTWYRVNAGPYASKAAAIAKQTELQQSSIVGVLVKQ